MSKLLDQYQAALLLSISPELLRYLTSHTVKKNDGRMLQVAKKQEDLLYFEVEELESYDAWLRGPWPSEPKKRPHLPNAIKEEVKSEAAGECALCQKNGNSCEAAHISPSAQTKCNHPHNLLWLCTNHHTKFDNGSIGPKGASNELIKATKLVVQSARKHIWQRTADVSIQLAALLKLAKDLHAELQSNPASAAEVEGVGKQLLKLLPAVASKSTDELVKPVLAKITAPMSGMSKAGVQGQKPDTAQSLEFIGSFEQEFLQKAGLQDCPLCAGSRWHNEQECPICQGEGSIPVSDKPDLSPFIAVSCRLCSGSGRVDGDTCPACYGEGSMEARFDEQVDWEEFRKVTCSLCHGDGKHSGDECPVCRGELRIPRYVLDRVDLRDYQEVDCPLCMGKRHFDGDNCPECGGDRRMQRRFAEQVDVSRYEKEDCVVCRGTGHFFHDTCRVCDGERRVTRRQNDAIDLWDYKLIACPGCKGTGCELCESGGQLPRYLANRIEDA